MNIRSAKEAFKQAYPGISVGISGTKEEPSLAARPSHFDEAMGLPEEFEGFPVEVKVVPNIRKSEDG